LGSRLMRVSGGYEHQTFQYTYIQNTSEFFNIYKTYYHKGLKSIYVTCCIPSRKPLRLPEPEPTRAYRCERVRTSTTA